MGIASPISALVALVPLLLISRFILNASRASERCVGLGLRGLPLSAPGFRVPQSVVGNSGESLGVDEDKDTNGEVGWHARDADKALPDIIERE